MGVGDNIMATGMAKGAAARGKRIAFGSGKAIEWDHHSEQVFKNNPNIAPLGSEGADDLEWINFCRGHRIYNTQGKDRWIWNYKFKAIPGEFYFTPQELEQADKHGNGFVIIEPNVPRWKQVAPNKDWGRANYWRISKRLKRRGYDVRQFYYNGSWQSDHCQQIKTQTFRQAAAILRNAKLYIGPEGGMHHAAAALGIPAVVVFGGFIPPAVTGYDFHTNLTGGAKACGSFTRCPHCIQAMERIGVHDVEAAALKYLE